MVSIERYTRRVVTSADVLRWPATQAQVAEAIGLLQQRGVIVSLTAADTWLVRVTLPERGFASVYVSPEPGDYLELDSEGRCVGVWVATAFEGDWVPAGDEDPVADHQRLAALQAFHVLSRVEDALQAALRLARTQLNAEMRGPRAGERYAALTAAARAGLLGGHGDRTVGQAVRACSDTVVVRRVLDAPVAPEVAQQLVGDRYDHDGWKGTIRSIEQPEPHVLMICLELTP